MITSCGISILLTPGKLLLNANKSTRRNSAMRSRIFIVIQTVKHQQDADGTI
jgi:hypothetical protein